MQINLIFTRDSAESLVYDILQLNINVTRPEIIGVVPQYGQSNTVEMVFVEMDQIGCYNLASHIRSYSNDQYEIIAQL
ncbi:hypothetical protein T265_04456 [Opisthorchis viverrini]|uniref:Uncharacterized protein n=1 Tax=Opisthorchis viverrini TaxID=6198 RepID=A0A074ZZQ1_OPIVI|nr:hypothetical protein T265_04456 [Opisthorchis viverrini]KER28765.1 hypothetical protein T265_04456 [Opisthorchis viverrini]